MSLKLFFIGVFALILGTLAYAQITRSRSQSPAVQQPEARSQSGKVETATFAAGCFWGVQDRFDHVKGVFKTTAGYTGGHFKNPTYQDVCSHTTGHAEAVQVEFDPEAVTYRQLVDLFWKMHDPTQSDGQGPDIGSNYRSAIFYHSPEQKAIAEETKEKLQTASKALITTEIAPAKEFYPAEEYHQHYARKHGGGACPTL